MQSNLSQVNTAYITQFTAPLLFSPIAFLVLFVSDRRKSLSLRVWLLYRELLYTLIDQNAAFTIPVGIAACISVSQCPTAFELNFLLFVVNLQFLCLISVLITLIWLPVTSSDRNPTEKTPPAGWLSAVVLTHLDRDETAIHRSVLTILVICGVMILPAACGLYY